MNALNLTLHNGQPRVPDLHVAEMLDYAQPRDVRKLIVRRLDELARYGEVCATGAQTSPAGGRPANEYLLNEGQALLICAVSETDKAADAREMLIRAFMDWRNRHPREMGNATAGTLLDASGNSIAMDALDVRCMDATARMRCVDLASRLHGLDYARQLYRDIGLPRVAVAVPGGVDEAVRCLDRILCADTHGHAIIDLLNRAMDDADKVHEPLRLAGILVENDEDGFVVANRSTTIDATLKGSKWSNAGWGPALRRLPGAMPTKAKRFGPVHVSRGTFLPFMVLDLLNEL